jgi:hypothetical protein
MFRSRVTVSGLETVNSTVTGKAIKIIELSYELQKNLDYLSIHKLYVHFHHLKC